MTVLAIDFDEKYLKLLQQRAEAQGLTAEDFVRQTMEELLAESEKELSEAIDYVVKKNAELYKRLA